MNLWTRSFARRMSYITSGTSRALCGCLLWALNMHGDYKKWKAAVRSMSTHISIRKRCPNQYPLTLSNKSVTCKSSFSCQTEDPLSCLHEWALLESIHNVKLHSVQSNTSSRRRIGRHNQRISVLHLIMY